MGKAAEDFGPDSPQRRRALRKLDEDIQNLHQRLNVTGMYPYVNIIITSDHGITSRPDGDRQIEIGQVLRKLKLVKDVKMIVGSGAYTMLYPAEDKEVGPLSSPIQNFDRRERIVRQLKAELKTQVSVYNLSLIHI